MQGNFKFLIDSFNYLVIVLKHWFNGGLIRLEVLECEGGRKRGRDVTSA